MNKLMVKDIYYKDTLVGQFYDLNHANGVNFPTSAECEFQFGFVVVKEDTNLIPHIHKRVERTRCDISRLLKK